MNRRQWELRKALAVSVTLAVVMLLAPFPSMASPPDSGYLALLCQVYEAGRGDGVVESGYELVGPDCVHRYPLDPSGTRGTAGQRQLFAWYMEAFPDTEFTVEEAFSQGNGTVVHWHSTGTHTGEFLGISPTGIRFEGRGTTVTITAGDIVIDSWCCWNVVDLLQQLGVLSE